MSTMTTAAAAPTRYASTPSSAQKAFLMLDPEYAIRYPIGKPAVPMLQCQYNPKDLTISGGTNFAEPDTNVSELLPTALFVRPQPRTMKLKLLFDAYPDGDVHVQVYTLWDWTQPRKSWVPPAGQVSAPWLRFQWGYVHYFRCFIESLSVTYTLFASSGAPLRATADISLKERADILPFTNPTSGGEGGERSCRVAAGDTLHSIAHRHYGQPRFWRGLAAVNGIDDPMRLPSGTVVSLPSATQVEELS
jgi:phage tail protein X